jgi:hypothetical protein
VPPTATVERQPSVHRPRRHTQRAGDILGSGAILHAAHRADPKRLQGRVVQAAGIVLLHTERESWRTRYVKQNMTLLMD